MRGKKRELPKSNSKNSKKYKTRKRLRAKKRPHSRGTSKNKRGAGKISKREPARFNAPGKRISSRLRATRPFQRYPEITKHLVKTKIPPKRARGKKEKLSLVRAIKSGIKKLGPHIERNTYAGAVLIDRRGKFISVYIPGVGGLSPEKLSKQIQSKIEELRADYKGSSFRLVQLNIGTIKREPRKKLSKNSSGSALSR